MHGRLFSHCRLTIFYLREQTNMTVGSNHYRLLMIAPQPWFQPRGTPFSVLHRIKALTSLGHHVDLATYHVGRDVPMENLRIVRAAKLGWIRNVKIGPSKAKIFLDLALYARARQLLKKNHYDLLHTHEEAGFFGVGLARRFKLPHLYDMHSSLPQQLSNFKFTRSKFLISFFEYLEKRTIQSAGAVITICPELQNYVAERFQRTTSVLIENVADNNLIFPADIDYQEHIKKELGLNQEKIVLYYGTLEPYQGLSLLIESAVTVLSASRQPIRFVVVGGQDDQIRNYQHQAQEHGVADHFSFTGFVQPERIPSYIDLAEMLVSTRMSGTNSPLKIYSYLRSGKPIVATDHVTHTQILTPQVAVLAAPCPRAFADGIMWVLDHPDEAGTLAAAAGQLAERNYSYQDYLRKTQWIVEQAVQNGRRT
jgi:glycosyltransferase involved in cell wall biosynthesis